MSVGLTCTKPASCFPFHSIHFPFHSLLSSSEGDFKSPHSLHSPYWLPCPSLNSTCSLSPQVLSPFLFCFLLLTVFFPLIFSSPLSFSPWGHFSTVQFSSVQSLNHVRLFVTPWIAPCQASLSITISRSSLKLTSIKSVIPSSHLILFLYPLKIDLSDQIRSDQLLSRVRLFATPWIAACQASLSITISPSSLKLTSIESVMPSSHLILCRPLLLLPSVFPSINGLFQWVSSSHQVAKVLEIQLQHQSFQWIFRVDFL